MPCVHEFGIIRNFSEKNIKSYAEYEPEKYNCISVHDDDIAPVMRKLTDIDTINPCIPENYKGLCHYGITVIPDISCGKFADILEAEKNSAFYELIRLLRSAADSHNYVIHYGI